MKGRSCKTCVRARECAVRVRNVCMRIRVFAFGGVYRYACEHALTLRSPRTLVSVCGAIVVVR